MSREADELNRRLLRARDAMGRGYAGSLDLPLVAAVAHISTAHFSRCFRVVFGESPRVEKGNDVQQGDYRWVTVRVPGAGATEISLEQPRRCTMRKRQTKFAN